MDRFAPLTDEDRATAILAAPPKHDDGDLISPVPADAPDLPMAHHQHGTRFGIRVDPKDGLLRQGVS